MSMDFGLVVGVRAMVARRVGGNDLSAANYIAGQAFVLCAILGLVIMTGGYLLAEPMMRVFGVDSQVVREGAAFLRVMFAGWVSLEVLVMGLYVIQSSGDTWTPMMIELIIRIVHVILCPLLVLGYWGFPALGVSGAALSNVISQILGAVLGLWFLLAGRTRLRLGLRDFRLSPDVMLGIIKIGVPVLIMSLQRSFGSLALTWFVIPFGTMAVAAHSIAARVDMFLFMPACAVAILIWAKPVMGIFAADPQLIDFGAGFLRIAAVSYLVIAPVSVLQSCISGAGDTLPNMVISITMIWAVQLPLAFILSRFTGLGVIGVRWAIVASTLAGTIFYLVYFKLGRWKMKRV
jgi:Na+-driven multidrug efflux pump